MNPKVEKITGEIDRLRGKITSYQNRVRELERQKIELENADIVAAVRGIDIAPDELAAFVRMFREQQNGGAVPDLNPVPSDEVDPTDTQDTKNKEDTE